jgi:hypothetical protein
LNNYLVSSQNPDEMHPQFTGYMSQNLVPVLEFNFEHRVRKRFYDRSFHLDNVLFGHRHSPFSSACAIWRIGSSKLLLPLFIRHVFELTNSEPELRVSYAACFAKAIRDFLAMEPDRFEMQHVFAFGLIEATAVAIGHKRVALIDQGDYDE